MNFTVQPSRSMNSSSVRAGGARGGGRGSWERAGLVGARGARGGGKGSWLRAGLQCNGAVEGDSAEEEE